MKLARIGNPGKEKPIIVDKDNNYRDVSSVIKDFNSDNLNFETCLLYTSDAADE